MKLILILTLLLLASCSKQNTTENKPNEQPKEDEVQHALSFVQIQKERADSYLEEDPPVKLDILEIAAIIRTHYPDYPAHFKQEENMFQTTKSADNQIVKFEKFKNWVSIKAYHAPTTTKLTNFIVEVYNQESYQQSKLDALTICKNIWKDIDHRVPPVLDELNERLNQSGYTSTSHDRHGYSYSINARETMNGYPVVCSVRYAK